MSDAELRCNEVKPRKPRWCIWCGQDISVGELCVNRVYTFWGDFHSDYYHPECFETMGKSDMDLDMGFLPYTQSRGNPCKESEI